MLTKIQSLASIKTFVLMIMAFIVLGCENESISDSKVDSNASKTALKKSNVGQQFYGPTQPLGNGVVRTSVTISKDGVPSQVAIVFSEKALYKLGDEPFELFLDLPNKANDLVIDHVALGWNPVGHEPGFYEIPHFDIHFYWITEEEQMMMTNDEMAAIEPTPEYVPATYFPTPGYVPMMGKHWLSGLAEELNPNHVFDKTYIFGSYNGDFIFEEAMITRDYFLGKEFPVSSEIFQAEEYAIAGYYPTTYSVSFDSTKKLYTVSLDNFVWHN